MPTYLQQLLADVFRAQGMPDPEKAAKLAERTLLRAVGEVQPILERFERDAHIYNLRGQRLTATVIGQRVGLCRSKVFQAIRRHIDRRRAALREVS